MVLRISVFCGARVPLKKHCSLVKRVVAGSSGLGIALNSDPCAGNFFFLPGGERTTLLCLPVQAVWSQCPVLPHAARLKRSLPASFDVASPPRWYPTTSKPTRPPELRLICFPLIGQPSLVCSHRAVETIVAQDRLVLFSDDTQSIPIEAKRRRLPSFATFPFWTRTIASSFCLSHQRSAFLFQHFLSLRYPNNPYSANSLSSSRPVSAGALVFWTDQTTSTTTWVNHGQYPSLSHFYAVKACSAAVG